MNRTMTVKTLFLLLVMWMPLAVPCHASWDDNDDDFYDYYTYEEWDEEDEYDEEDWDDYDEDGTSIYGGTIPEVIVDGTDRSDDNDDWADFEDLNSDTGNIGEYDEGEDWTNEENPDENADNSTSLGNSGYNQFGERLTKDALELLEKWGLAKLIEKLPKDLPKQSNPNDCVINACAFLASLEHNKNFKDAHAGLLNSCMNLFGIDLKIGGPLPEEYVYKLLSTEFDNIIKEPFNKTIIEDMINNNHAVLAILETGDYLNYVEVELTKIAHMVTIVGYDIDYYYCVAGDGYYTAVPKTSFKMGSYIYTVN